MSKWSAFANAVKLIAPIAVTLVNPALGPVVGIIVHAVNESEAIEGATGIEKLNHAKSIVHDGVTAMNAIAGKELVPVDGLDKSVTEAINTTVDMVNVFHKKDVTK